jgi:very-short-patch-repair endonuclease
MKTGRYPSKEELLKQKVSRAEKIREDNISRRTEAELKVKEILDDLKVEYIEQYPIYTRNSFILIDFYLPKQKIAIEIDGTSHEGRRRCWQSYNKWREKIITGLSTGLIRFQNNEILTNADNFREFVLKKLLIL